MKIIEALPSLAFDLRDSLPPITAVYFVTNGDEDVIYIGSTNNLLLRFKNHHRLTCMQQRGAFRISWAEYPKSIIRRELYGIEIDYIHAYSPMLGYRKPTRGIKRVSF